MVSVFWIEEVKLTKMRTAVDVCPPRVDVRIPLSLKAV